MGKKKTLSLGGGEPLSLRKPGESGRAPARGGMGGGRKTVKVEVRRRRVPGRPGQVSDDGAGASSKAPSTLDESDGLNFEGKQAQPTSQVSLDAAETTGGRARHVLKTLSTEEKSARARALDNAQAADQAARDRAEENARRQADEAARLLLEKEAADNRRREEEERKKSEEEARLKAEEEASRKLAENEAKAGAEADVIGKVGGKRSDTAVDPAEQRRTNRRSVEKPKQQPRARTEPRRRAGRITVTEALADREERVRSLTSIRRERERRKKLAEENAEAQTKIVRDVVVPETITVQELANRMAERGVDVVRSLMGLGVIATVNQTIDADTAELVVAEFGHKLRRVAEADVEIGLRGDTDNVDELQPRAPVVTVMGHVDHGKTSLLDAIRESDVAEGEAGGITQHIGAYQVTTPNDSKITFIDTPGHAAFTAMRARGAKVTDLVVLVVAADDGVMPQTVEAINHARAASVPLIVAVNKIDLPDANPEKVKQELLQHEVISEEMGGDVQVVEVSAIQKQNLDELEEVILLQAELQELRANPHRLAEGVVIEAKLDRGRGAVATVLVQRGTLRVGEIFVAGSKWGKVRALLDSYGNNVDEATPSMPVEILGLNGAPYAGDEFSVVGTEARAREVADYRQRLERDRRDTAGTRGSLEEMFSNLKASELKEFQLLFKADVRGSLEAILAAVDAIGNEEVRARVLHAGVGGITESDIDLARASNAVVIGFNVRANPQAKEMARQEKTEIRYYSIIYELVDDLKMAMSGLLDPEIKENIIGGAEVLEVFSISKMGKIAGCRVNNGLARRQAKVRLLRDNVVIHTGNMKSLKRFKDDANEVHEGNECGVALESYQDIQSGDQLEFYEVQEVQRSL